MTSYFSSSHIANLDNTLDLKEKDRFVTAVKEAQELRLVLTILGALAVFWYIALIETATFEQEYYDTAETCLQSLGSSLETSLCSIGSLSSIAVSFANVTNQTFPFVTIPEYAMHAAKIVPTTGAVLTYFSPIVTTEQLLDWEHYAAKNNTMLEKHVNETLTYQEEWSHFYGPKPQHYTLESHSAIQGSFGDLPYKVSLNDSLNIHVPTWQRFPLIMSTSFGAANNDFLGKLNNLSTARAIQSKRAVVSGAFMIPDPNDPLLMKTLDTWCDFYRDYIAPSENCMEPISSWYYPVLNNLDEIEIIASPSYPADYEVKALIIVNFYWRSMLRNILTPGVNGIILVVDNTCGRSFTYKINGPSAQFFGSGDRHDSSYDGMVVERTMSYMYLHSRANSHYSGVPVDNETCLFTFRVYPSDELRNKYSTINPVIYALSAAVFIIVPFLMFQVYDKKMTRQRNRILNQVEKSDAIISSIFPAHVQDKMLLMEKEGNEQSNGPIADLYPEVTVLFADIADFTVWSSVRDPNQVFELLEGVYYAFDECAERRGIYKVETVGDCYLAVCGLPEPRSDHAVAIAKFAKEILLKFSVVTSALDSKLGPGTAQLKIRIGLNSGPTTAGVLRGSRGRYQLFGDTVNTAARMESNSYPGRIMCSRKTADLLIADGKGHWLTLRDDVILAKGKGAMQCYWCNPTKSDEASIQSAGLSLPDPLDDELNASDDKLVGWLSELFGSMLGEVISHCDTDEVRMEEVPLVDFKSPWSEVSETIVLPKRNLTKKYSTSTDTTLSSSVKSQLRLYIATVASMYRNNPFHNIDHAGHVVMATKKLLSRVIKPTQSSVSATAYGITSDPLTQFAILFSALIHDVDHPGVSNAQLVKEGSETARRYNNKSVAEQNSIDKSWDLLMRPDFEDLRYAIMPTASECRRFRQLLVNAVMATDLFDADLKSLRESRWSRAFHNSEQEGVYESADEDSNRRATIVIEHIIQASDVSHTMQHWHVYQKWNRKLFFEMHAAYLAGRSEKDPAVGWYEGELWFFDNYIIPLAKKLKTCGVFGVSCDELLDYAVDNRTEWASKGREIVAESIELAKAIKSYTPN